MSRRRPTSLTTGEALWGIPPSPGGGQGIVTTSVPYCYPALANAPTATTPTTAWAQSAWVEIIPPSTIATDIGIYSAVVEVNNWATDYTLDIGTGSAGNEVVRASLSVPAIDSANVAIASSCVTLPTRIKVPANTRVAFRVASSGTVAVGVRCALNYYPLPLVRAADIKELVANPMLMRPSSTSAGLSASLPPSNWGLSSIMELFNASAFSTPVAVLGVTLRTGRLSDHYIELLRGASGSEARLGAYRASYQTYFGSGYAGGGGTFLFPSPLFLPASTRLAVRYALRSVSWPAEAASGIRALITALPMA